MLKLLKYAKNYVLQLIISSLAAFIFAFGYVMVIKYGFLVLLNWEEMDKENLYWMIFWLVATGLANAIEHYLGHDIAFRVLRDFRSLVYKKVRQIGPRIPDVKDSSNLLNLLGKDIDSVEVFYAHTLVPIIRTISFMVAIFILYLKLDKIIGLYMLLVGLVYILLATRLNKGKLDYESRAYHKYNKGLNTDLRDMVKGKDLVVQLNLENTFLEKLDSKLESLSNIKERRQETFDSKKIIVDMYMLVTLVGLYLLMESRGLIQVKSLYYLLIFPFAFEPYKSINKLPLALANGLIASDNLFEFLESDDLIQDGNQDLDPIKTISIEDLDVSYGQKKILENVNLDIKEGAKVGFYGPSGAGKTSLAKVLMAWYPYDQGKVHLNDIDLKKYKRESVFRQINYMPQSPNFFKLSIRDNLTMFNNQITDDQIVKVLERINLKDKVFRNPRGLDLVLRPQDMTFSSGELQRLDLARALLNDASLLILDEPLSNLDSNNEKSILDYIDQTFEGIVIIISHRYEAFEICDQVYEIKDKSLKLGSLNN